MLLLDPQGKIRTVNLGGKNDRKSEMNGYANLN